MHILLLHNNHPGQFKYLIPALLKEKHKILFLSSFQGTPNRKIKQVWAKKPTENPAEATDYFRSSLERLSAKYRFDLIISHSGFFCGLYAKYFFPETPLISYLEWWFSNDPTQKIISTPFIDYKSTTYSQLFLRNRSTALELSLADAIVSPTEWQCKFLPKSLKEKVHIIFDGVPNDHVALDNTDENSKPYITYASRGLEPIRCFPEFIKTLPFLRAEGCDHRVFILGGDKVHYGCGSPSKSIKSFRRWAKTYLHKKNCSEDIIFLGKLKYKSYLTVLKYSTLHIHLTQPFVPSWSMFDALALGTPTLITESPATNSLISRTSLAQSTNNTFDPEALAVDIKLALRNFSQVDLSDEMRTSKNKEFFEVYGREQCIRNWLALIGSLT